MQTCLGQAGGWEGSEALEWLAGVLLLCGGFRFDVV